MWFENTFFYLRILHSGQRRCQGDSPLVYLVVFHSWDLLSMDHGCNDIRDTRTESFSLTLP